MHGYMNAWRNDSINLTLLLKGSHFSFTNLRESVSGANLEIGSSDPKVGEGPVEELLVIAWPRGNG